MNRRGQVTFFIILGLLIVISTLIYIGMKADLTYFDPDAILAPDATNVKNFVEQCLREVVEDGVTLVAFQGGYSIIEEGPWKLSNDGEYQEFLGPNGFKIPYWQNKGKSFAPDQQKVEEQLEIYIDSKLEECIGNFSGIKENYQLTELAKPESKVLLGRQRVSVELDYPVDLKTMTGKGDTIVNNYRATVASNMLGAIELAHMIKEHNDENLMLWNRTINIISGSELPFKGYEFDCSDKSWTMEELEEDFNNLLSANLHYITYKNTFNEQLIPTYEYPDYYQGNYFFDIGAESRHRIYSVNVEVIPTTYFSVAPNKGGIVRNINLQLPMIGDMIDPCINLYNHFYSADYAVKFSITDSESLKFNFIIPLNMLLNNPQRSPEQFDPLAEIAKLAEAGDYGNIEDYCKDSVNEVDIFVEDSVRRAPIFNATVYYDCVKFRCQLGITDYPRDSYGIPIGTTAKINDAKLPDCINGNLVVEHPDYIPDNMFFTPSEYSESTLKMKLKPIVEIPVDLQLRRFVGDMSSAVPFDFDTYGVVISVYNHDLEEYDYSAYMPDSDMSSDLFIRIPLNSTYDNNLTFDVRTVIPNTNISVGGYFNNQIVKGSDLVRANKITIDVLASELDPITYEETRSLYQDIIFEKSSKFPVKMS
ncbi:hypothetical protein C0585_07880 [Candidatus Woesearchaeota archaeon]|nr:MAG: hypothetical protein C0585_07880 [Candidatus Woesearchaeota archaeon]